MSAQRHYENLGELSPGARRLFLPPCDGCGHPYRSHAVARHPHPGDCFECPERCDYRYPTPSCARCGELIETSRTDQDGQPWHSGCWIREEYDRGVLAQVYDGWSPPEPKHGRDRTLEGETRDQQAVEL